ncbi:MAG: hypothetical protein JEY96_17850 [Bacteroidales bacterium]|nr:hypothetical protein [Bacteroidales bacterium]
MRHISSVLKFAFIILIFETSCLNEELEREILIETGEAIEVLVSEAVLKGDIIDFGKGIDQYGHCWSRNEIPTLEDSITVFQNDEKREYESVLSNLKGGVTYFYRVYSISGNEIKYGEIKSFKTEPYFLPMVHLEIDEALYMTVTGKIELLSLGGYDEISEIGICLSTVTDPLINKRVFYINNVDTSGYYTFNVDNLIAGKKYYIKSYAVNKVGVKYSFQQTFTTKNISLAEISIESISDYTETSSKVQLNLINFGGMDYLLDYGICISETPTPTFNSSSICLGSTNYFGERIVELKDLKPYTKYYIRAFAKNNGGMSYSGEKTFTTRGLVSYFPFNGDLSDYSGNMNHAINYGATLTSDRFGNSNSACSFDGLNDYIELSKDINTLHGITASFWIKSKGAQVGQNNGIVISKYSAVHGARNLYISSFGSYTENSDNRIYCQFFRYNATISYSDAVSSNWTLATLPDSFEENLYNFNNPSDLILYSWKFIVVNMTEKELQIWIDGNLSVSKTREFLVYANSNEKIYLGNSFSLGGEANNHFNGELDDIRIYNHPLTENEIKALYHEGGW